MSDVVDFAILLLLYLYLILPNIRAYSYPLLNLDKTNEQVYKRGLLFKCVQFIYVKDGKTYFIRKLSSTLFIYNGQKLIVLKKNQRLL